MNDKTELAEMLETFNPVTDTGRALKFFCRQYLQDETKHGEEYEAMVKQVRRVADAIDRQNGKPKIDGWRFLRSVATDIAKKIDELSR